MSNQKFNYMLLSRLQSDFYTWQSGGGKLWGITPEYHAAKMVELWDGLQIKPEWLGHKELKAIYLRLTKKELKQ